MSAGQLFLASSPMRLAANVLRSAKPRQHQFDSRPLAISIAMRGQNDDSHLRLDDSCGRNLCQQVGVTNVGSSAARNLPRYGDRRVLANRRQSDDTGRTSQKIGLCDRSGLEIGQMASVEATGAGWRCEPRRSSSEEDGRFDTDRCEFQDFP